MLGGTKGHCGEQGIIFFFSVEKETRIIIWEQVSFVPHRIISVVKRIDFLEIGFHI